MKPICTRCGYNPSNIGEYIEAAHLHGVTPDEYVRSEEGTYNPVNGHFYCTSCYCEVGMPLGVAP